MPLRPFRELAILLAVGVLVDSLVVRPLLIPGLLSLLGARACWPGSPLRTRRPDELIAAIVRRTGTTDAGRACWPPPRCAPWASGSATARLASSPRTSPKLGAALDAADGCDPFGYGEFLERVGRRAGPSGVDAARGAPAVMAAIAETVAPTELDYVRASLIGGLPARCSADETHRGGALRLAWRGMNGACPDSPR